jgi:hypothetical protein
MGDDRVPGTNGVTDVEYVCPLDASERESSDSAVPFCPQHGIRMKPVS